MLALIGLILLISFMECIGQSCLKALFTKPDRKHLFFMAVVFYGIPGNFDPSTVRVPVLAHFATIDQWCTPEAVDGVESALRSAGSPCQLFRYEARHAFFNALKKAWRAS